MQTKRRRRRRSHRTVETEGSGITIMKADVKLRAATITTTTNAAPVTTQIRLHFQHDCNRLRDDFVVMVTHHVVTVMLISFSYVTNYFRIGTVVMFLHDASDFWLEAAKMFKYVGSFWPCMGCFCVFILVWIVTRLYCFPFRVIASVFFEAPGLIGRYPALDMFAAFLSVLQVLHIFWTIQIIRTAVKPFTTGQLTSDARSDSEMSETDNDHTHASDLSLRNDHCNGGAQNGITRSE
ncbi:unnamed protein product [Mesocestoides corti]|uniref:TLC domain-containing protein n=1 Tax=Mesocestoides corti TaxID=53468 RepID=A0A0R3UJ38_MESCO|nr:unnamed protein product [Mesocestoides corti]